MYTMHCLIQILENKRMHTTNPWVLKVNHYYTLSTYTNILYIINKHEQNIKIDK